MPTPLDLCALSDDACDNLIGIFLKARPALALELVDLAEAEPEPQVAQGRFKGKIKSWWPEKGYGFLDCTETYEVYACDIYINRLAIGLFQKGDEVHFSVELNKEGKPQGKNLLPVSLEAKRRQLMAACDPQFDLEGYLVKHQLGPYAPGEQQEKKGRGRGTQQWPQQYGGPVWGAPAFVAPSGPYEKGWAKGGGKMMAYPLPMPQPMVHPGKGKGKKGDGKGWDMMLVF